MKKACHQVFCGPQIHFLVDQGVRNALIKPFEGDMVVQAHPAALPVRKFKGGSGRHCRAG
jgi:hypothetical protein